MRQQQFSREALDRDLTAGWLASVFFFSFSFLSQLPPSLMPPGLRRIRCSTGRRGRGAAGGERREEREAFFTAPSSSSSSSSDPGKREKGKELQGEKGEGKLVAEEGGGGRGGGEMMMTTMPSSSSSSTSTAAKGGKREAQREGRGEEKEET